MLLFFHHVCDLEGVSPHRLFIMAWEHFHDTNAQVVDDLIKYREEGYLPDYVIQYLEERRKEYDKCSVQKRTRGW